MLVEALKRCYSVINSGEQLLRSSLSDRWLCVEVIPYLKIGSISFRSENGSKHQIATKVNVQLIHISGTARA